MTKQFPNIAPSDISWKLVTKNFYNPSLFGGTGQTLETPGSFWWARLTYENLEPDEMRPLIAFLLSLRGPAERFKMWNFGAETLGTSSQEDTDAQGYIIDSQASNSIATSPVIFISDNPLEVLIDNRGLGFLQIGDFIELRGLTELGEEVNELKMVIGEEIQGSGVRYKLSPFLRHKQLRTGGSATGRKYKVIRPQARFRLLDDEQLEWDVSEKIKIGSVTIEVIEAPV